ncbi:hypothetical protein GC088_08140 [Arthrobacter sp. JZ12]|uniref:acVLRF1 family peptidyl-tRNA hydrolase n=1 Tax=Arthrobacter sp. JZ12 TaxID=2654190 RepID=UPI002B4831B7|nr:acVLRF1 family peptidyl-tRNA hydrolase [Arthrobacter sp. JZ12]WRH25044.1 hypothetical protein GC088_08140 [Arthrobacter sp. JZ12]
MQDSRLVLVPPDRLPGWVRRFGERNGDFSTQAAPGVVVLRAVNGCTAEIKVPQADVATSGHAEPETVPSETEPSSPDAAVENLLRLTAAPRTVGLLLVRRGGYGVGVSRNGELLASKTGTRYVQSRTAAGGWSQQRFARRRANQADALVESTVERAAAIFGDFALDVMQPGGDAQLVGECLAQSPLATYRSLPRLPHLPVQDPRLDVLRKAATDANAVRIHLTGIPAG